MNIPQKEIVQQLPSYGQIYRLTNKINGKMYHGQTTDKIKTRWTKYRNLNCKDQPKIYNALKKYGPENFLFEVIDVTPQNQQQLNYLETFYIRKFDSFHNGYNCNEGGDAQHIISDETRRKISESKKGSKNPNYGIHHTKEYKENMSNILTGRIFSDEHRMNLSKARIGKKFSDEHKKNLSKAKKGHKFSIETRMKLSAAQKRRWELLHNQHNDQSN